MLKKINNLVIILLIFFIFNCKKNNQLNNNFFIYSKSIDKNGYLKQKHLNNKEHRGKNISIHLKWGNIPINTKSLAILIIDENIYANNYIHWGIVNIPDNIFEIKEGKSLTKELNFCKELYNSSGFLGYNGPFSIKYNENKYKIIIYALNIKKINEFEIINRIYNFLELEELFSKYLIQKTYITFQIK